MAFVSRGGRRPYKDSVSTQRLPTTEHQWRSFVQELDRRYIAGDFTPTLTGWSSGPSGPSAKWQRNDNFVTVSFGFASLGTSDTTTLIITNLPDVITPTTDVWVPWAGPATDNGVTGTYYTGAAQVQADGTVDFHTLASGGAWTAANSKGWALTDQCTFTYPLFPPI